MAGRGGSSRPVPEGDWLAADGLGTSRGCPLHTHAATRPLWPSPVAIAPPVRFTLPAAGPDAPARAGGTGPLSRSGEGVRLRDVKGVTPPLLQGPLVGADIGQVRYPRNMKKPGALA